MNKINQETITDKINYIKTEKDELNMLLKDLNVTSKGLIHRFFFTNKEQKKQHKLYKNKAYNEILLKKQNINSTVVSLNCLSSFRFDTAMKFIADALTIIEGEKYECVDLEFIYSYSEPSPTPLSNETLFIQTNIESICLITTTENKNIVQNKSDLTYSDEIDYIIDNNKYIKVVKSYNDYQMLDYNIMKSTLQIPKELVKYYTYLTEIITDLINLRVSNKELSEYEAINIILNEIPNKYAHLINKGTCNKQLTKI